MKKFTLFLLFFICIIGATINTACTSLTKVEEVSLCDVSYESTDNYKSATITARIFPASAKNKAVDYSLAWADNASKRNEDVNRYVAVEQDSDGSLNATIKCFKGFLGDEIILTVTTRDGGHTDTCTIVYDGVPNSLIVGYGEESQDAYISTLLNDNTINYSIKLTDGFCDDYTGSFAFEYGGNGALFFADITEYSNISGSSPNQNEDWWNDTRFELDKQGNSDDYVLPYLVNLDSYKDYFFDNISISNGELVVKFAENLMFLNNWALSVLESSYQTGEYEGINFIPSGYSWKREFKSVFCKYDENVLADDLENFVFVSQIEIDGAYYVPGEYNSDNLSNCYFWIKVTERNNPNLTSTIKFFLETDWVI